MPPSLPSDRRSWRACVHVQTMLHVRFLHPRLHDSDWERLRKSAGFGERREGGRGRRGGSVIGGTLV